MYLLLHVCVYILYIHIHVYYVHIYYIYTYMCKNYLNTNSIFDFIFTLRTATNELKAWKKRLFV